jgi:membrane-associated phospholipid phosphatase
MRFFQKHIAISIIFWLVLSLSAQGLRAQEKVYHLDWNREVPLLGLGAAGTVTSLVLRNQRAPLQITDFSTLERDRLLSFDRTALNNYNESARLASDIFLNTSYLFPLVSLAFKDARQNFGAISLTMLQTILFNETLTGITKTLVGRPRPFTYNDEVPDAIRTEKGNNFSFFSGHTSYTAAISFFSAQVLTEFIDDPLARKLVWAGAIAWPAATGYFRYAAGKHFITDVVTGYAVGALIGYFIPGLHKVRPDEEKRGSLSLRPGARPQQLFSLVFVL